MTFPAGAVDVVANYSRTADGWSATVEALLPDDDEGMAAEATGVSLAACHQRVMDLIAELSNATGLPVMTIHALDGDAAAFVKAYEAEVGPIPLSGSTSARPHNRRGKAHPRKYRRR